MSGQPLAVAEHGRPVSGLDEDLALGETEPGEGCGGAGDLERRLGTPEGDREIRLAEILRPSAVLDVEGEAQISSSQRTTSGGGGPFGSTTS